MIKQINHTEKEIERGWVMIETMYNTATGATWQIREWGQTAEEAHLMSSKTMEYQIKHGHKLYE